MTKTFSFPLLLTLALIGSGLSAQVQSGPPDYTFTISSSQTWTDTGVDLQNGDVLRISASAVSTDDASASGTSCDPAGISTAGSGTDLPLSSARPGALIARLQAHGALPLLVGTGRTVHVDGSAHLFLGVNSSGAPPCQGSFAVRIWRTRGGTSAGSEPAQGSNATGSSGEAATETQGGSKPRSEQLRSQLSTAAQVFMSGQFGMGKSESASAAAPSANLTSGSEASSPAPALKVSDSALDSGLRKSIDSLPRRVNDQFKNLGDMVNFVIVGSQQSIQAALDAANWHVADTSNEKAVLSAVLETYESKDYLQMPMSTLYLFGRRQDFGYEMAEPIAMVASRHHFRIWKAPFTWNGQEVWVGAGTHDIGFAKDKRNGLVTHKIDPAVDGERDNIGASLQKSGKAKTLYYYLPPDPVQEAKNATGDGYHSDGRLLVVLLQ